jgi:hypothetical protein
MISTYEYTVTGNGQLPYGQPSQIKDTDNHISSGALTLPHYAKLDGKYVNSDTVNAYVSSQISDGDGNFGDNSPVITVTFARQKNCSGLRLRFNSWTGDYPAFATVKWMSKNGTVISQETIEISESEYYLYRDIEGFASVELTFLSTSKPYRPVFIEYIGFLSLRVYDAFKIVYDGRSPGASSNISISSASTWQEISNPSWITKDVGNNIALCTPRYSKLNGRTKNQNGYYMAAWVSKEYSDGNGKFATPPVLTVSLADGYYTSTGVNISTGWATGGGDSNRISRLSISWRRDGVEVASAEFTPTSRIYFCEKTVENFNSLVITFIETATPYRPVVLSLIELGCEETYTRDVISSNETVSEISQISEELSINSLDFSLKGISKDIRFQKKQELSIWFDGEKQGVFYVKTGKRSSRIDYDVYAEDAISLLDETWYGYTTESNDGYHAWFNNALSAVVYWILKGSGISYSIDDSLKKLNVFGYLPICTRREALQQVAFAVGAIVDTFGSNVIRIVARDETKEPIVVNEDYITSMSIEDLDDVSKVVLTAHNFVLDYNSGNGQVELFNSQLPDGQNSITLNDPCVVFSSTNTQESYFNNAINLAFATPVDASQNVVLKGYKQVDNTVEISKINPKFPTAQQNQNVITIKNAYFVHSGNANEVLERIYQYYLKRKKVTVEIAGIDVNPGDMVTVPLYDGSLYTGMVERVTSTYSMRAFREVVIR